jgi:hypothetical protein
VPAQDGQRLVRDGVPEAHGAVASRRGELGAVRAEGHVGDVPLVPRERGDLLPRDRVPEVHRPLQRPRGYQRPRRVQNGPRSIGLHHIGGALPRRSPLPRGRIPEGNAVASAERDELPAVAPVSHGGKDLMKRSATLRFLYSS